MQVYYENSYSHQNWLFPFTMCVLKKTSKLEKKVLIQPLDTNGAGKATNHANIAREVGKIM